MEKYYHFIQFHFRILIHSSGVPDGSGRSGRCKKQSYVHTLSWQIRGGTSLPIKAGSDSLLKMWYSLFEQPSKEVMGTKMRRGCPEALEHYTGHLISRILSSHQDLAPLLREVSDPVLDRELKQ